MWDEKPSDYEEGDEICPMCDGLMEWCTTCQVWSSSCCCDYGTCLCS